MDTKKFFAELKRRNVYKVVVAYAVVGWLLIQVAASTFPFLQIPGWATRLVIVLVFLGFPIALVLAWAFEMSPTGIRRTEWSALPESASPPGPATLRLNPEFDSLRNDPCFQKLCEAK